MGQGPYKTTDLSNVCPKEEEGNSAIIDGLKRLVFCTVGTFLTSQ